MEQKKDSGWSWLAFWKIDKEDVRRQVENYSLLKLTNSSKGLASLLLIGSIILSFILSFVGWVPLENVIISAAIYLPIIFFVYKGNRLAIVVMMIAWTVERAVSIATSASSNFYYSSVLIGISLWAIVMNLLYEAFRVEQLRKQKPIHTVATNDLDLDNMSQARISNQKKSNFFSRFIILLIAITFFLTALGSLLYLFQTKTWDSKLAPSQQKNVEYTIVKTFSREKCTSKTYGGDEIYTDWFTINSNKWRLKLVSDISDRRDDFSNVRIWYTTSGEKIDSDYTAYNELGSGLPNYDKWFKNDIYDINYGPSTFRLRILCWNANFQIDIEAPNP